MILFKRSSTFTISNSKRARIIMNEDNPVDIVDPGNKKLFIEQMKELFKVKLSNVFCKELFLELYQFFNLDLV